MFPYTIILYDEQNVANQVFRTLAGRDRMFWADVSTKTANHLLNPLKGTQQSVFFAESEADANDLLEVLAKNNPNKTWVMYTSLATAEGAITDVRVTKNKFDKNGKLPT